MNLALRDGRTGASRWRTSANPRNTRNFSAPIMWSGVWENPLVGWAVWSAQVSGAKFAYREPRTAKSRSFQTNLQRAATRLPGSFNELEDEFPSGRNREFDRACRERLARLQRNSASGQNAPTTFSVETAFCSAGFGQSQHAGTTGRLYSLDWSRLIGFSTLALRGA